MSAETPPGLLIWTALPAGRGSVTGVDRLQLSVLLSPRFMAAAQGAVVSGFPGFADWPATARGLQFSVRFDDGVTLPATLAADALDSAAWAALMAGLGVTGHRPLGAAVSSATPVSYPVRQNYAAVLAGYRADVDSLPDTPLVAALPAGSGLAEAAAMRGAARRQLATLVGATEAERQQVSSQLRQLQARHGTPSAGQLAAADPLAPQRLLFAQMADYYDRLSAGAQARYEQAQTQPPVAPALDVHGAMSAMARYPLLMRRLGLVLDLVCPWPASGGVPAPLGKVGVRVAGIPAGWAQAAPNTCYALDASSFSARSDPAQPLPPGLLLGGGLILPQPENDTALALDLDPLVHGVRQMALGFHSRAATGTAPAAPMPPAPRSAGLSLARAGLDAVIGALLQRVARHEAELAQASDGSGITLAAEDLMRGFRVDVRRVGEGGWRSLHWRRGSYRDADGGALFAQPLDDEGCAALQVFNPEPVGGAVWTHETLFRWTGWSLSVPRPGQTVAPDGSLMDGVPPDGASPPGDTGPAPGNLPLRVRLAPVPGSLPRLRFGADYECRLRTVDLAGNGLPPDAPSEDGSAYALGRFLRFDPLRAPALRMRDAAQPAESVDHIVLRSELEAPAAGSAERLLAPPRSSAQMAEWHACFDLAAGLDPAAYAKLVAHDGDLADAPYGDRPPALPYLPDPLARGASLRVATPPGQPQLAPVKLPFDGPWPALQPLRLQVVEGNGEAAWDPAQRLYTVPLAKGRRLDLELASWFDAGHFDAVQWVTADVRDLALFDYWNGLFTPGKLATPQKWAWLWNEIVLGHNEHLTPHRNLTLVHAVPRPLLAPLLDETRAAAWLDAGSTCATVSITTPLDLPSTAQVELMAEWDEMVDDGTRAPYRRGRAAHVGRIGLDYPQRPSQGDTTLTFRHEFHDTRSRQITYWLVATTRYPEYFPDRTDPAQLTQVSPRLSLAVRSSTPPLPPRVLHVLPIYAWDDAGTPGAPLRRRRSGLRVVLDRPWFASGDGEQLGVVMKIKPIVEAPPPPDPGPPGPLPSSPVRPPQPVEPDLVAEPPPSIGDAMAMQVTQWGLDPALRGAALASPFNPLPRHFGNARAVEFLLASPPYLGAGRQWDRVLAAFDVQFEPPDPGDPSAAADPRRDPHDGRWFCDLELDAGTAHAPFIRLALVRLQPGAMPASAGQWPDARISPVTVADFVQLAPGRSASIVDDPAATAAVIVTVDGPSYQDNAATDATARPAPAVRVDVQLDIGDPGAPVWVTSTTAVLARLPGAAQGGEVGASRWQGPVPLPGARGTRPMRAVLREILRLPADRADRGDIDAVDVVLTERLVYCDVLAL